MPSVIQLKEKRANVWSQMTSILDTAEAENRDLTPEERSSYDAAESDLDQLTGDIERQERHEKHQARAGDFDAPASNPDIPEHRDNGDPEAEYRDAFQAFVVRGLADLDPEQAKLIRSGWIADGEKRAAAVGSGSAGGYLVPQGFRAAIVNKMKDYGAVENVAQVITTTTGNPLPWPTNDDTANVGALLAENTQVSEQDITLGTAQLDAYKYTSKLIRVSIEFLQDVDWMDTESFLAGKFAERLGRIENQHFTTGTGSSQPDGIVTGSTSGVTAASATAFTLDELIDLEHSVDPAYRRSPRVKFMFADTALKAARKFKDGNGNYIWQPSVQAGVPSTVQGYGYEINQDMPAMTTGNKPVLFGDFYAGYVIRKVRAFQMIRMNERYADYFQVGFVAFERADGEVQDSSAYKALTLA